LTSASSINNALNVVLAQADDNGGIYVYPLNGPQTHAFVGGVWSASTGPATLSSSTQSTTFAAFALVDYAAEGAAATLPNSWNDKSAGHTLAEAVVFTFDTGTFAMTPFWTQASGTNPGITTIGHLETTGLEMNLHSGTFQDPSLDFTFVPQ